MITAAIIAELNSLTINTYEDYVSLDRLDELTARLLQNHDGHLACGALLDVLARHPQVDFGTPGQVVHAIESYRGHYEEPLLASLDNRPTATTIWMLNRILNAASGPKRARLLDKMSSLRTHPLADEQATAAAKSFHRFQTREK